MRAGDLAQPYPTVTLDTDAMEAARMMTAQHLPGLIVCGDDRKPYTVLPGSQVLRFLVPPYVQEDPALARAYDERGSDELRGKLFGGTVRELLPNKPDLDEIPVVDHHATTIEVAAVMARMRSPVVAVVEGNQVLGAITANALLAHLLPATPTQA